MRNLKKELREKLRAEKKEKLELRKELLSIDKESPRAIEIRNLLGISTMQDVLGDNYPKRVCRNCGKRAHNSVELMEFTVAKNSKYGYDNCCIDCSKLRGILIVGPHTPLAKPQTCEICQRVNTGSGNRSWFLHKAKVCKYCLGTHEDMFGYPLELKEPKPLAYKGITITSYTHLGELLDLPADYARYLLITNKLKEITWISQSQT